MYAEKDAVYFLNTWSTSVPESIGDTPAELFDTHPLSEMILTSEADSVIIDSLVLVENHWRPEWHKNGVQVLIQSDIMLHKPNFGRTKHSNGHLVQCCFWSSNLLQDGIDQESDRYRIPLYQVDDLDFAWLSIINEERECLGSPVISVGEFERVMETLEHLSYVKLLEKIKALEAESLEFDENSKCDVCLSYEGEDGNELVFCDGCLLCVHQACYGIPKLPEGSWICRQCEAGLKSTTPCSLCPNTGGAMKATEDGTHWCHISCALWVPEVNFRDVELMEPVVGLCGIPQARRRLLCCICRSRYGAPIQCSHKKCKVAFHVTCAFQSNLTMRQELVEKEVHLVSLCPRHSRKDQKQNVTHSPKDDTARGKLTASTGGCCSPTSSEINRCDSSAEWREKLIELENNFYKLVDDKELELWLSNTMSKRSYVGNLTNSTNNTKSIGTATSSKIASDVRSAITVYWRLKRRANFNQPLISPTPFHWRETASKAVETTKEALALAERAAADIHAFEAFRRIRFGLDRARLVVDMVLQRERRKLALFRRMWRIFELQARFMTNRKLPDLTHNELIHVLNAHIGGSVYDNWSLFDKYDSDCFGSTLTEINRLERASPFTTAERLSDSLSTILEFNPEKPLCTQYDQAIEAQDAVLYTIPYEQLVVPEDIRQRLRSTLNAIQNNPERQLLFRENIQPLPTSQFKSAFQNRRRKRPLSVVSVRTDDNCAVNDPIAIPTKHFRQLQLNCVSNVDSFSSQHIPVLAKFTRPEFKNGSAEVS